jgi:hypothetical protein
MVVHFDNVIRHTVKCVIYYLRANRVTRVPHRAFSPDLAPSTFYLFSKLEMALVGAIFAEDNELLHGVMEVLNRLLREERPTAKE